MIEIIALLFICFQDIILTIISFFFGLIFFQLSIVFLLSLSSTLPIAFMLIFRLRFRRICALFISYVFSIIFFVCSCALHNFLLFWFFMNWVHNYRNPCFMLLFFVVIFQVFTDPRQFHSNSRLPRDLISFNGVHPSCFSTPPPWFWSFLPGQV